LLLNAEKLWVKLDQANIFMEEPRNNGGWIKSCRALGIPDPQSE
jgi:hypothetical protein